MKPLIAALLLTGCAAQPQVMPSGPAVYQNSGSGIRQACIESISRTLAFAEVTEPVLDKCLAGNRQQCVVFAMLLDRHQPQEDGKASAKCFESGDTFGGLAYRVNKVLPSMNKKLGRYNKLMGAS